MNTYTGNGYDAVMIESIQNFYCVSSVHYKLVYFYSVCECVCVAVLWKRSANLRRARAHYYTVRIIINDSVIEMVRPVWYSSVVAYRRVSKVNKVNCYS